MTRVSSLSLSLSLFAYRDKIKERNESNGCLETIDVGATVLVTPRTTSRLTSTHFLHHHRPPPTPSRQPPCTVTRPQPGLHSGEMIADGGGVIVQRARILFSSNVVRPEPASLKKSFELGGDTGGEPEISNPSYNIC